MQFCVPGLLDSLVETQTRLNIDYRSMPAGPHEQARNFMQAATAFLEFLHIAVVGIEVARRHGATNQEDIDTHQDALFSEVSALTKLSPAQVFQENLAIFAALQERQESGRQQSPQDLPERSLVVSAVNSILQACPLDALVDLATHLEMTEHGSRCQVAIDGLRYFTRRNDQWMHQRLKVVGVEYTLGQTSIEAVAQVLDLPIADTVALLEDHGYSRPLEQLALTEASRSALYGQLREDRLRRSDKPEANPARVARVVVASQRIEGIDARPWVHLNVK
jgi:hypothetical protein